MCSPYKSQTGFGRLWRAWNDSVSGLYAAVRYEEAFRQEIALAVVLIPIAFLLRIDYIAKALMIGSIMLVLVVELVNSAIEATVDRISLESHDLAKRAKDLGSAAVLLSLINAAVIWGLVLLYGI